MKYESDVDNIETTFKLDVIQVGDFLSGILVSKMVQKRCVPEQINFKLVLSNSMAGTLFSCLFPKMMYFRHDAPNYI